MTCCQSLRFFTNQTQLQCNWKLLLPLLLLRFFVIHFSLQGALAHPNTFISSAAARDCLHMYDQQRTSNGALAHSISLSHAQSKRFLDREWAGLPAGEKELPLRSLVEDMSSGLSILQIMEKYGDAPEVKQLLRWVSSFRLASCLNTQGICLLLPVLGKLGLLCNALQWPCNCIFTCGFTYYQLLEVTCNFVTCNL